MGSDLNFVDSKTIICIILPNTFSLLRIYVSFYAVTYDTVSSLINKVFGTHQEKKFN